MSCCRKKDIFVNFNTDSNLESVYVPGHNTVNKLFFASDLFSGYLRERKIAKLNHHKKFDYIDAKLLNKC